MSSPLAPEIPRTFDSVLDLLEASCSSSRFWVRDDETPNTMMFTDDCGDCYTQDADGNFTVLVEDP